MHDITGSHWHEPKAGENAGFGKFLRKPMPYDTFMESEGVPIYRGIGVKRDHSGIVPCGDAFPKNFPSFALTCPT